MRPLRVRTPFLPSSVKLLAVRVFADSHPILQWYRRPSRYYRILLYELRSTETVETQRPGLARECDQMAPVSVTPCCKRNTCLC
jgi:hypothetical protein